jgi:hypothetical protein
MLYETTLGNTTSGSSILGALAAGKSCGVRSLFADQFMGLRMADVVVWLDIKATENQAIKERIGLYYHH